MRASVRAYRMCERISKEALFRRRRMKSRIVVTRELLGKATLEMLAVVLPGCAKPVTGCCPDGTPYTEEVDNPVAALAGVVLFILIAAAIAAYESSSSSSRNDDHGRRPQEGEWDKFFSGADENVTVGDSGQGISLAELMGPVLSRQIGFSGRDYWFDA